MAYISLYYKSGNYSRSYWLRVTRNEPKSAGTLLRVLSSLSVGELKKRGLIDWERLPGSDLDPAEELLLRNVRMVHKKGEDYYECPKEDHNEDDEEENPWGDPTRTIPLTELIEKPSKELAASAYVQDALDNESWEDRRDELLALSNKIRKEKKV